MLNLDTFLTIAVFLLAFDAFRTRQDFARIERRLDQTKAEHKAELLDLSERLERSNKIVMDKLLLPIFDDWIDEKEEDNK